MVPCCRMQSLLLAAIVKVWAMSLAPGVIQQVRNWHTVSTCSIYPLVAGMSSQECMRYGPASGVCMAVVNLLLPVQEQCV